MHSPARKLFSTKRQSRWRPTVPTRWRRNAPMMIAQRFAEAPLELPQEWKRGRQRQMQLRRAASRVALRDGLLHTHQVTVLWRSNRNAGRRLTRSPCVKLNLCKMSTTTCGDTFFRWASLIRNQIRYASCSKNCDTSFAAFIHRFDQHAVP